MALEISSDQVTKLHDDAKLSLAKNQNVATLLSSAPLTINLIGQVRLLAFSENAIRTKLQKPKKGGFHHLKYDTLTGCMQQLVNQATNSFRTADENMEKIVDLGPQMFGSTGHVTKILSILPEPKTALHLLEPTMEDLNAQLEECENGAVAIYKTFDLLRLIAEELNEAIGNQITITQDGADTAKEHLTSVEINGQYQKALQQTLEKTTDKLADELDKERKEYKKELKKGTKRRNEFKDMGIRSALGVQNGIATAFKTIVGVVRDTPKIALTGAQAIGAFGGATVQFNNDEGAPQVSLNASQAVDPIYAEAAQFYDHIIDLDQLIAGDLLHMLQEQGADGDLIKSVEQLKSLRASLTGCKSSQTPNIRQTLNTAAELGENILSKKALARTAGGPGGEWENLKADWKKRSNALLLEGLKFNAAASVQPGMALGEDYHSISTSNVPGLSDSNFQALQARRQVYLATIKTTLESTQRSLKENEAKQLENQKAVVELTTKLKTLKHKEATFALIQVVLRESLDCITKLQFEVANLLKYFSGFSTAVNVIAKRQVNPFIRAIKAGIDSDPVGYRLEYGPALAKMIVNSLLAIRAQFSLVLDSARLYVAISESHIIPCLGEMSKLETAAPIEKQNDQKDKLASFTAAASGHIAAEVKKQYDVLNQQAQGRITEIVEESRMLALPQLPLDQRQAIAEGVNGAAEQIHAQIQAKGDEEAHLGRKLTLNEI